LREKVAKKGVKKDVFELLVGKEVVMQLLRGTIITGTFLGTNKGYFVLGNEVEIKGKNNICRTQLCLVHINQVQHMHLKGEIIRSPNRPS